jgi:hypothetical protein
MRAENVTRINLTRLNLILRINLNLDLTARQILLSVIMTFPRRVFQILNQLSAQRALAERKKVAAFDHGARNNRARRAW